jgi:hypothetical protein
MPGLENLVLLLLAGICVLFLGVIGVRFFAALKTSRWTETQATILTSETRARRPGESGPETVPHIEYEYTVSGHAYRSHQLKPRGIPLSLSELPHFLGRYPAGSAAPVYYNPASPQEAVLEREPLSLSAERLGCLAVFAAAILLALVYGLKPLHGLIQRWFPHCDNEDVLALTTGMGVFLLLFGLMWLRQGMKEVHWPTVSGTIVSSKVESFKSLSAGGTRGSTHVTMYRAAVVYAYEVAGRSYQSRQIRREELSGSEDFAKGLVAQYAAGSSVRVRYNPDNAADAILESSAVVGLVVLWGLALAMFAVAASVSGYFRHS